jgi:hypothetical protein
VERFGLRPGNVNPRDRGRPRRSHRQAQRALPGQRDDQVLAVGVGVWTDSDPSPSISCRARVAVTIVLKKEGVTLRKIFTKKVL